MAGSLSTTHKAPGRRILTPGRGLLILVMLLTSVVFIIPYAWMFLSAFKTTPEVFRYAFPLTWKTFFPPEPTLANFISIIDKWHFERNILNSLIAATGQTVGTLVVCSLSAFAFARLRFFARDLLFGIVMVTAFIPFEVIMVPLYMIIRWLNLTHSYLALFLPWIVNPFGIFLLRQAFIEIPRDFDEAAMVEGASLFQIFWHIILPNTIPSLISLALISFLFSWNAFLWPLIAVQDPEKKVVQVAIATFTEPGQLPAWGELFAGASIATLPILFVFLVLQRYYIRGVIMSGMKG